MDTTQYISVLMEIGYFFRISCANTIEATPIYDNILLVIRRAQVIYGSCYINFCDSYDTALMQSHLLYC